MLPLLRVLPLCALLASVVIFALATTPEGRVLHASAPARGPLIDANEHPEWRQFLLQAAYRRADEIGQLRLLPDRPTIVPPLPRVQAKPVPPAETLSVDAPAPAAALPPIAAEPKPADTALLAPVLAPIAAPEADYVRTAMALPLPTAADFPPAAAAPADFPVLPFPPLPEGPVFFADVPVPPLTPAHAVSIPPVPESRPQQLATLSHDADAPDAEEITGSIESPAATATLPVEIGETSSTELPVLLPERAPLPRAKPQRRVSARPKPHPPRVRHAAAKHASVVRRAQAAPSAPQTPATQQPDFFQTLFGSNAQPATRQR